MSCPTSFMSGRTVDQRQDCSTDFSAKGTSIPNAGFRGVGDSCILANCETNGYDSNDDGIDNNAYGCQTTSSGCTAPCNPVCPNITDNSGSVTGLVSAVVTTKWTTCQEYSPADWCTYECTIPTTGQLYYKSSSKTCTDANTSLLTDSYGTTPSYYAIHGYDPNQKHQCCAGVLTDNVNCALCWCPNSQSCNTEFSNYCVQKDANGEYNMFSDSNCQIWAGTEAVPGVGYATASSLITNGSTVGGICSGDGLLTNGCQAYCAAADNVGKCDTNLTEYCQHSLPYASAIADPICDCYLPSIFYTGLADQMASALGQGVADYIKDNPVQCIYPQCATNDIQPKYTNNVKCPNISECLNSLTVDNSGTIVGNIVTTQNNSCGFNYVNQVATSTPSTAPSTQPSTQPSTTQPSTTQPSTTQPSTSQPSTTNWFIKNQLGIGVALIVLVVLIVFLMR